MEMNGIFRSVEVMGATKEEALANAPFNTGLKGADCTQALRNAKAKHKGAWTTSDQKQFELAQLEAKTKNAPGFGCYIVVESAVADSRERPWKKHNFKNEKGTRKYGTVLHVYENVGTPDNPKSGEMVYRNAGRTKTEADAVIKELYKNGCTKNLVADYAKELTEGEPHAFTYEYTPSKNSRPGIYKVFGVESVD